MKTLIRQLEAEYSRKMEDHLRSLTSTVPYSYIVNNFAKYVRRQELTRFLFRYDLFKEILNVKGSIVECGVFAGSGLMTWAQLSAILEPVAFLRKVFGFDTFEGFPAVSYNDTIGQANPNIKQGDVRDDSYEDLKTCIKLFDMNRFLPHLSKVQLIKGDFLLTSENFMKENPYIVIALLYLDFDLYEPTKKALEIFLPRMPKGSVLAFDEINNPNWPGETLALLETMNIRECAIRKYSYEPNMSYIVL